ncbi:aspartate aminotransferase family protein [Nostocales cyanobacterium HT-58-2]|nr:aspartate aminotransferase family protein [Nostocales cyanobacterium HT-58-2]
MTPEEFRRIGHKLIDWIADYRARIDEFPVMSQSEPGSIRASLPTTPPEVGESLDASLLEDLEHIILPGVTHWNHPNFFAYFPSNASLASVLGDLLSTGLGAQGMSWQTSPAATELEEVVVDWLRQLVGLSENFVGVIHDTASTANLVALLCARERMTNYAQTRGGLQAEQTPLTVYTSSESHSSVEKAALLAGFGRVNVRAIETDDEHAMRADALESAINSDRESGLHPCAVVATIGTTPTTALDPLDKIAQIARSHNLWLHVDAALAGAAMILPECRYMWAGIESADSLVWNPHKWLGVAFDCSVYYVRDPQHLIRVMSTNPSYLQTGSDGQVKNFRDWGIPLGRRFRALKLWLLIRSSGAEGLRDRLRRDLKNAQWLREQVDTTPNWERVAPVPLQTVCVRYVPPGMSPDEVDAHTLDWVSRINRSGKAYLTPAKLKGRWMVRVSIGAELTEHHHIEALWLLMRQEAERHSLRSDSKL